MTGSGGFREAIAGKVLTAAGARRELLQSITDTARAIFLAQAASIAVLDEPAQDFIFEAVAGQGDSALLGTRFPAGQGIAGAVAQSGEPVVIDDLSQDPRFARTVAAESGYTPQAMMVAPLLRDERTLGVLSVLDRGSTGRTTLQELDLLTVFAHQAAVAVDVSEAARSAAALLDRSASPDETALARLIASLDTLEGDRRDAAARLMAALTDLLA